MSRTAIVIAALLAVLSAAPAQAAARDRVFVASYGNDTNPCTFGSPCKTFQVAVGAVAAGGEVTAIDSAGFGPITINKSVTITSPDGVEAGIATPAGQNAININAGPSDAVVLHGLTIDGANAAVDGIAFGSGKSLVISNCVIRNLTFGGIVLNAPQSDTQLTDSTIENNTSYGVYYAPVGGAATFTFNRVGVFGNGTGLSVEDSNDQNDNVKAAGSNSVAAGNGVGYETTSTRNSFVRLSLDNIESLSNTTGLRVHGGVMLLSRSTVDDNGFSFAVDNSGNLYTYGNNQISEYQSSTGAIGGTFGLQ